MLLFFSIIEKKLRQTGLATNIGNWKSVLFKSTSRCLNFFFIVFKEKGQNNFMQLNNKDVFHSNYSSREAEIYIFTYWSCFLQLSLHRFLYLFSFFLLAFVISNIINKNKLLCGIPHILYCNYGIFVVILIFGGKKNNSVFLCIK